MKKFIGSLLGGFFVSIISASIFPGICLMTYLSTSGAGGFAQKECIDTFWSFFNIFLPSIIFLILLGNLFKMKWVDKIDIFRLFKP